jgi:hypothetical protein
MPRKYIPRVSRVCAHCGASFATERRKVDNGGGLYCKVSCHLAAIRHLPRKRGAPRVPYPVRTVAERFWEKVDQSGGPDACWLWTGHKNANGYGRIADDRSRRIVLAPRASWELNVGPIPEGVFVLHNCPDGDNPACVNPAHLWLGTQDDNMRDAGEKRRVRSGESHHNARLTDAAVLEIRSSGMAPGEAAKKFGVTYVTAWEVVTGRSWKHVKPRQ